MALGQPGWPTGSKPKKIQRTASSIRQRSFLAEQGYLKTTVVDISKQAGLSEAALYEYFQGKEDLLLAISGISGFGLLADVQRASSSASKGLRTNSENIFGGTCDASSRAAGCQDRLSLPKTIANFMNTPVYANVRKKALRPPRRYLRGGKNTVR